MKFLPIFLELCVFDLGRYVRDVLLTFPKLFFCADLIKHYINLTIGLISGLYSFVMIFFAGKATFLLRTDCSKGSCSIGLLRNERASIEENLIIMEIYNFKQLHTFHTANINVNYLKEKITQIYEFSNYTLKISL